MSDPKKKPPGTSVRFELETKELLDKRHKELHISKSDLICMAVERCLADGRWTASSTHTDSSEHEKVLHQVLVDLSQVITKLAFSVNESLESKSRVRRLEASNLVRDAFIELELARKKLNVH